MADRTVAEVLDQLAAGEITLADVVSDFSKRTWSPRSVSSDAQAYGVADTDPPDDDSWATVESDSRLTSEQYAALVKARES